MIARQLAQCRPFEVAHLFMNRTSQNAEHQARAMTLMQQARTVFWTRLAVFMAALSLPIAIVTAIIAAAD